MRGGAGDVSASEDGERAMLMVVMLAGASIFAVIISNMSAIVAAMQARVRRERERGSEGARERGSEGELRHADPPAQPAGPTARNRRAKQGEGESTKACVIK